MIKDRTIHILQLYPKHMNIYGDWGNVLTVKKRLEWQGYLVQVHEYNVDDALPETIDIVIGGGGQDSGQIVIQEDLLSISARLHDLAREDTPMLVICGLYQLFGKSFITNQSELIEGIDLLDIETVAGPERLIGNVVSESEDFGTIIGYENHSGQTLLGPKATPLAIVTKGVGNNPHDKTEGARYRNVIGSYLHGSLLPKNPAIADFLIKKALINKFGEYGPKPIDDSIANLARNIAAKRPR